MEKKRLQGVRGWPTFAWKWQRLHGCVGEVGKVGKSPRLTNVSGGDYSNTAEVFDSRELILTGSLSFLK